MFQPGNRAAPRLLALVALLVAVTPSVAQEAPPVEMDRYIEREMEAWSIPGMAVAVVHRDSVVLARGYGVRELGRPELVNEHTLFGVASTTKAMTAAALGMLVDEGLLDWDDPVVEHMPEFRLSDPEVTREVRVRHLLTHTVGVGRITGNRIQFMTHEPREEIIRRMRFHDFEQPFENYVYSNVMYSVAGELIPAVTGQSWDDFLRERIFAPLGMERSNTSVTEIGDDENAAWPHQEIDGHVVPIPRRNFDNVGPSASVNTSVREMAEWIRLHLGEPGVYRGERLLSEEVMREMHGPQIDLGGDAAYGLGWRLDDYEGQRTLSHGGASDGMATTLYLMPEEEVGVLVVANTFNLLREALARRVADAYLGRPERDWSAEYRAGYEARYAAAQARRDSIHDARVEGTEPTHAPEAYTGTYADADSLYGRVEVREGEEGLELHFWGDETLIADLEHWHHDTFRARWRNPAQREKFVWFTMDRNGRPEELRVQWTLRPVLLQVGIYPTDYYRIARFARVE